MGLKVMVSSGILVIVTVVVMSVLQGCGSDYIIEDVPVFDDTSSKTQMVTGRFVDDFVQGVDYTCSSKGAGTTDANGTYSCASGDDVTFFFGEVIIATASANNGIITPYTLFPDDRDAALNLARFLQTTDGDGEANNGVIVIDADTVTSLPADTDFSSAYFETSIENALDIELITTSEAQKHLDDEIVQAGGIVPVAIILPVADAGRDQNVPATSTVVLDGSGSHSPGETSLSYLWSFTTIPYGSNASLSESTVKAPFFMADLNGSYVIELVVFDGDIQSAADSVTITVTTENAIPVAEAGNDQSVQIGDTVTLDGTKSSDADFDALSYAWRFSSMPEESNTTIDDAADPMPTFIADAVGQYVIGLVVEDERVKSSIDEVIVTVRQDAFILDNSFAVDGIAAAEETFSRANAIALSAEGDVFVVGYVKASMFIWKYDSSGVLDSSFGGDGISTVRWSAGGRSGDVAEAIAIDDAGGIYVAGHGENSHGDSDMIIWKFRGDGSLDDTFSGDGMVIHHGASGGDGYDMASAIALDASGNIYVVGSSETRQGDHDMVIWKYRSDGTPSSDFGVLGVVVSHDAADGAGHDFAKGIVLDTTDKLYVTGYSYNSSGDFDLALWKYSDDGQPDETFGHEGLVLYDGSDPESPCAIYDDYGEDIVIDGAGDVFVAGTSAGLCLDKTMLLWKYSSDGRLLKVGGGLDARDTTGGRYQTGASALAIDGLGDLYVTGYAGSHYGYGDWPISKHDSGLLLDRSFGEEGNLIYTNPYAGTLEGAFGYAIAIDTKGSIYSVGYGNYGPEDEDTATRRTLLTKYKQLF